MSYTGKEAFDEIRNLQSEIKKIVDKFGYDGEDIIYDHSPDNNMYTDECRIMLNKMDDVVRNIRYLEKPIRDEGILRHNSDGRYEFESGTYFTSGDSIEILEDEGDYSRWNATRIEHNGEDYYAVSLGKDISINGKRARCR
ncbi:DUF5348 domain-containing protein [Alkalihalobacillus oceani]|uniref:DUF5348 domain-containing protein n=1 Tax=Halalkalibacter oceani TaxID=1653776 RepID=A0A9X2DTD1_9BACI|nr:DUF5348 domain-containing protein [Halalkalibacter oceani]MCM3716058.1 DUF5348 domain-containing protein [Halalkalibacter oceani]